MLPIIFRGHSDAGFFAHALSLSPSGNPLEVLPGNQRTAEVRYACMIVVRDYERMRYGDPAAAWHYRELEPDILSDVREGRAVLVFDLSNEGPVYVPEIFDELYAWIEANALPKGRTIWLAQNRAVEAAARSEAGARADLVRFEYYDYFVKIMAWVFSPSSPDSVHGIDADTYIAGLFDATRKDRLLLCLNATPRLSRILTVAALHHHGLLTQSLVSFPGLTYVKSGASLAEVLSFLDAYPRLDFLRASVYAVGNLSALTVDAFPEQGNQLVEKIDPTVYQRTYFSLVTESDFVQADIARITEKTAKSYCMGHPTVVIGNARAIEFIKAFGFQDWGDLFDRAAESQVDPAARFDAVVGDVVTQVTHIRTDGQTWLNRAREVGVFNFRYAVSGRFLADAVAHTDQVLVDRLSALVGSAV